MISVRTLIVRALFLIFLLPVIVKADGTPYHHYFSVARETSGAAISAATISVYTAGTNTIVPIFNDLNGASPKSNPMMSDVAGNYEFYAASGLYKIVVVKIGVGTFTVDNVPIGVQLHSETHGIGMSDELLLSELGGSLPSSRITDGTIVNADVNASAAITESKLALSFPTHSNTNDPTSDQKAALGGTAGSPSVSNKYVTNTDSRNTNSRTPTPHASTHTEGGSDAVSVTVPQISGVNAGTNISSDLEEETHATEHQNGGSDEISVSGLSGVLVDGQNVTIFKDGSLIGTRPVVNLIEGSNIDLSAVDNSGSGRVDITFTGPPPGSGANVTVKEGLTIISSPIDELVFNSSNFNLVEDSEGVVLVDTNFDLSSAELSGDVTGLLATTTVEKIQGFDVAIDTPNNNDALIWDNVEGNWEPRAILSQLVTEEGNSSVVTSTNSIDFGSGFDVSESPTSEANIALDLSEVTISADRLKTSPLCAVISPFDGNVLKYNDTSDCWEPSTDNAGATASVEEEETQKVAVVSVFDFGSGFDVSESPAGEANVSLDVSEIPADSINDTKLDWGSGANQIDSDDIPEGSTNKFLSSSQESNLTGGGDTTLHYHAADRNMTNAVGVLPAAQVGNGLTNAQVSDTLTIGSGSSVDASTINSGSLDDARLGDVRTQWNTISVPYPEIGTDYGAIYFPKAVTVTQIALYVLGGVSCKINFKNNGTPILTTGLSATSTAVTSTINNPNISSGNWVVFSVESPCGNGSNVVEVNGTIVYTIN